MYVLSMTCRISSGSQTEIFSIQSHVTCGRNRQITEDSVGLARRASRRRLSSSFDCDDDVDEVEVEEEEVNVRESTIG